MNIAPTVSEQDLSRLLAAAGNSFAVPDPDRLARAVRAHVPEPRSWRARVGPKVLGIAAALCLFGLAGTAIVSSSGGSNLERSAVRNASGDGGGFSGGGAGGGATSGAARAPDVGGLTAVAGRGTADSGTPSRSADRIVKTGQVSLVVAPGRVPATLSAVQALATARGGIVFSSSTQESGTSPTGRVTLRVPVQEFEATVLAVRRLDADVRSAQTKAADVSAQYTDLQAKVRALRATRERYLVLLARADSLSEILAVQQRVDKVSLQLDQVQGRLRLLSSQTAMSTLSVSVAEQGDPSVRTFDGEDETDLGEAFDDAIDGFTGGVEALVRHSGTALVVGLCLAVVWFVGGAAYRLVRRRSL